MSMNPSCQVCGMEDAEVVHCTGCACSSVVALRAQLEAMTRERDSWRSQRNEVHAEMEEQTRQKREERQAKIDAMRERDEARESEARMRAVLEEAQERSLQLAVNVFDPHPRMGDNKFFRAEVDRSVTNFTNWAHDAFAAALSAPVPEPSERTPRLTREDIAAALKTGTLEATANAEYRTGKYDAEKGGPALKALNEHRDSEQMLRVVDAAVEACRMQILGTAALPEYNRGIRHCLALLQHLDRRAVVTKVLKAEQQPPTMQATQLRHLPQPGEYNARVKVFVEGAVFNIEVLEFIKS